jgi:hypothetical protein
MFVLVQMAHDRCRAEIIGLEPGVNYQALKHEIAQVIRIQNLTHHGRGWFVLTHTESWKQ